MSSRSYSLLRRPPGKPAPGTPLNPHHPAIALSAGVKRFFWPLWEANPNALGSGPLPRELITGLVSSVGVGNGYQWAADRQGLGLKFDTGDDLILGQSSQLLPLTPNLTVIYARRRLDTTLRSAGHWGTANGTGTDPCGVFWPLNDGNGYFDFAGQSNGTSRLTITPLGNNSARYEVFVFRVHPKDMRAYRNGARIGKTAGTTPTRTDAGTTFRLNKHTSGGQLGDKQWIELFALIHMALPEEVCLDLSINPWGMFESELAFRSIFIPATAGDGSAAGTSTASAVGSAIVSAAGSSAGAATVSGAGENAAAFHEADGSAAGAAAVDGISNPRVASVAASAGAGAGAAVGDNVGSITELLPLSWEELQALTDTLLLQWQELQLSPISGGILALNWLEREGLDPLPISWIEIPAGLDAAEELDPQHPYLKIEG